MHIKTLRDRKYLDHLRSEPCVFTGLRGTEYETVDPAHIGTGGKGLKGPDSEALPVLHSIHAEKHQRGEMTVVREKAPDWLLRAALRAYARELYEEWNGDE